MDLSLVQTNDLLEEITKRYDAIVLTGVKYTKNNGEYVTFRRFAGNRFVCSGLINFISHMISQEEYGQLTYPKHNEDR